eukprot:scaffold29955_cov46-Phaeocystis_antarctica.AAC.1
MPTGGSTSEDPSPPVLRVWVRLVYKGPACVLVGLLVFRFNTNPHPNPDPNPDPDPDPDPDPTPNQGCSCSALLSTAWLTSSAHATCTTRSSASVTPSVLPSSPEAASTNISS